MSFETNFDSLEAFRVSSLSPEIWYFPKMWLIYLGHSLTSLNLETHAYLSWDIWVIFIIFLLFVWWCTSICFLHSLFLEFILFIHSISLELKFFHISSLVVHLFIILSFTSFLGQSCVWSPKKPGLEKPRRPALQRDYPAPPSGIRPPAVFGLWVREVVLGMSPYLALLLV